jgi:hypothetical protein
MATKQRIALPDNTSVHAATAPTAVVIEQKPGTVTVLDRVRGYYKGLIALIGALLVTINELTPITDFLPADQRHWITIAVSALTALSTTLVANEKWVDDA